MTACLDGWKNELSTRLVFGAWGNNKAMSYVQGIGLFLFIEMDMTGWI
jgi:hypothetical protein